MSDSQNVVYAVDDVRKSIDTLQNTATEIFDTVRSIDSVISGPGSIHIQLMLINDALKIITYILAGILIVAVYPLLKNAS